MKRALFKRQVVDSRTLTASFGSLDRLLCAEAASGELQWRIDAGGPLEGRPVLVGRIGFLATARSLRSVLLP